jgi:hypothetical protein
VAAASRRERQSRRELLVEDQWQSELPVSDSCFDARARISYALGSVLLRAESRIMDLLANDPVGTERASPQPRMGWRRAFQRVRSVARGLLVASVAAVGLLNLARLGKLSQAA